MLQKETYSFKKGYIDCKADIFLPFILFLLRIFKNSVSSCVKAKSISSFQFHK